MSSPRTHWADRSVMVTGSGGLLGGWLCQTLLDQHARVVAFDRSVPNPESVIERHGLAARVAVVQGDIADTDLMARVIQDHGVETVFHTAAVTQVAAATRDPRRAYEVNIGGTWSVLEALRAVGRTATLVLASTDAVYGDTHGQPCAEDRQLSGMTPYAVSKICAELLVRAHSANYRVRTSAARFTNLYGGGDGNTGRIVPSTVLAALRGDPPVIRSDGRARRDYLHVRDAVGACLRLGEALAQDDDVVGQAFNFSSERLVSVLELVQLILQAAGRTDLTPAVLDQTRDEVLMKVVPSVKARAQLGWRALVPLERGLAETVAWFAHAGRHPGHSKGLDKPA